jgi:LPS sulfotransferase NodH
MEVEGNLEMTVDVDTKFVVLTDNRSGSTWVMSTLNSLEGVTGQGELFLPRPRVKEKRWDSDFAWPRYIEAEPDGRTLRPFSVFAYLDALYRTPGAVGFKLMYAQLAKYPEILPYLMRHRVRVVHLVRENHLDVVLSYAVKAELGRAHLLPGQAAPDKLQVELDTKGLVARMERLRKKQEMGRRMLEWCRLPHMEVAYEDLLEDPDRFRLIWAFLSIDSEREMPEPTMFKIRQGGHRDVISNYDEVSQVMASSRFAGMLA